MPTASASAPASSSSAAVTAAAAAAPLVSGNSAAGGARGFELAAFSQSMNVLLVGAFAFTSRPALASRSLHRTAVLMGRKPGVSSPEELAAFVGAAGDRLIVLDVRNPDFALEPGDAKSSEKAPIAGADPARARAINCVYDRAAGSMDTTKIPADWIAAGGGKSSVPVITHCGGGGRGQKAKEFLEAAGFSNVLNGGGPEDDECWAIFGSK